MASLEKAPRKELRQILIQQLKFEEALKKTTKQILLVTKIVNALAKVLEEKGVIDDEAFKDLDQESIK